VSELSHEPVLQQFPDAEWDESAGAIIAPLGQALAVAEWLLGQGVDYCSNVTGVDYLEREVKEKVTSEDGKMETVTRTIPSRMDVVYHLYSMQKQTGPLVLKQRTNREQPQVQSLTPVWRSCELQEREVYDLFGVDFTGHPDQRRILMWDQFEGHPMRKDYTEPFDYEWEPTPHDEILDKHKRGKVIV
jgi:NADH-quinone oxidoreductase subunit C